MNLGLCFAAQLNEGTTEPVKLLVRLPSLDESAFPSCLAGAETLLASVFRCRTQPGHTFLEFGNGYGYEKQETQG